MLALIFMQIMQEPSGHGNVRVSVILPTRARPQLVLKAVASALAQDLEEIEVIAVMDGDDPQTRAALSTLADARLSIIELPDCVGGAEARNIGVRAARGEWVAFLDDDDEWLPHKLSHQLDQVQRSTARWPVISSRVIVQTPSSDFVRPLRSYNPRKPVSEYLFCRKPLSDGPYAMQTSTLLMSRDLMHTAPFRRGLKRHQDWDWVLRAACLPGVELAVIDEPLVMYRTEDYRESLGRAQDWRFSAEWGKEMRPAFSRKAYSWFLATECASRAAKSRAGLKVYAFILWRFVFDGLPTPGSVLTLAAFLALPKIWREKIHRIKGKCPGNPMLSRMSGALGTEH
jgi:glycosyltransferase involved in cell wall biosynthesis